MMLERRVDAIIIVGSFFIESNPKNNQCILDAAGSVPVFINGNWRVKNIYCMLCDDFNSSYMATSELISTNVRDILFLYTTLSESEKRKMDGYIAAMKTTILQYHRIISALPAGCTRSYRFSNPGRRGLKV